MSLESIKLEKFYDKLPVCAAWLGFRRSGKSLSCSLVIKYLVSRKAFKRMIFFVGNKFCNPELCELVSRKFDKRMIFHKFSEALLNKIIQQQADLREIDESNTCCIIFDDVYTAQGRYGQAMNRLTQSGRHYLISVFILCVSWSDIAPSARRSLDFITLFSNITLDDTKFLTRSFLNRHLIEPARFALKNNELYTGLCIETSPVQKLWLLRFSKRNSLGYKKTNREKALHSDSKCLENEISIKSPEVQEKNGREGLDEKNIVTI